MRGQLPKPCASDVQWARRFIRNFRRGCFKPLDDARDERVKSAICAESWIDGKDIDQLNVNLGKLDWHVTCARQ